MLHQHGISKDDLKSRPLGLISHWAFPTRCKLVERCCVQWLGEEICLRRAESWETGLAGSLWWGADALLVLRQRYTPCPLCKLMVASGKTQEGSTHKILFLQDRKSVV